MTPTFLNIVLATLATIACGLIFFTAIITIAIMAELSSLRG